MPFPARAFTHDGVTLPLAEWAARRRLPVETIRVRIDRLGWSVVRALDTSADRRFRRGGRPEANSPARPRVSDTIRPGKPSAAGTPPVGSLPLLRGLGVG